jgi:hypothetical protein
MRHRIVLLVLLFAWGRCLGQSAAMIPQLKKTVVFIQLECQDGDTLVDVRGTGFFVGYPDERLGKDLAFGYLITNRHVAMCWDRNGHPLLVRSIAIRLNRKNGSSDTITLSTLGNAPWVLPTDESVDLAALGFMPNSNIYDYTSIPISLFGTKDILDAQGIGEGERILFTGFFYQFPGVTKVQPILREGVLAMMPDEKLRTTTGKVGSVYLGDVHVFGGNSGAPVFFNLGGLHGNRLMGGEDYRLLGVVSGMFYEDEEFNLEVTTTLRGTGRANSGICMIVPVDAIKSLLDQPALKARREAAIAQSKGASAPRP